MPLNKTEQILAFKSLSEAGKLALLSIWLCLLHQDQLLFCVTSQYKTMLPCVVHRPMVG